MERTEEGGGTREGIWSGWRLGTHGTVWREPWTRDLVEVGCPRGNERERERASERARSRVYVCMWESSIFMS